MRIIESAHPRSLNLLAVGPGGLVAAASSEFGARVDVEVWDAASGTRYLMYSALRRTPSALAVYTDKLLIGERLGQLVAVVIATRMSVPAPPVRGGGVAELCAHGERLLVVTQYGGATAGGAIECCTSPGPMYELTWIDGPHEWRSFGAPAFAPDGARAANAVGGSGADGRPTQLISLRDAATGNVARVIPFDPASPVLQMAFTADGSKLAVRTDGRTVHLFDASTGAAAGELVHPGRPYVTAVAAHPGAFVACARTDGTVTFWDAEKRERVRTLDWKAGKLVSLAFAPDGALAAAGTEDGKVVVWDVDL